MSDSSPFLVLGQPCHEAIAWVIRQVNGAGLQVMRTFDLQAARHDLGECPCPHHGRDQCDCQLVVLLIYGDGCQPISLMAHGYDGETRFSLIHNPQQRADPHLEATIRGALAQPSVAPLKPVRWPHAA